MRTRIDRLGPCGSSATSVRLAPPRLTPLSTDTGDVFACDRQDLNLRPSPYKGDALPTELLATYGDVRLQLLDDLLGHRIQHTACRSSRGLLGRPLRAACFLRSPRPTRSARRPRLRGSDCARYPFRYSMASWFSQAGRHHAFPVRGPPFPARRPVGEPTFLAWHSRPDYGRPLGRRPGACGAPVSLPG